MQGSGPAQGRQAPQGRHCPTGQIPPLSPVVFVTAPQPHDSDPPWLSPSLREGHQTLTTLTTSLVQGLGCIRWEPRQLCWVERVAIARTLAVVPCFGSWCPYAQIWRPCSGIHYHCGHQGCPGSSAMIVLTLSRVQSKDLKIVQSWCEVGVFQFKAE